LYTEDAKKLVAGFTRHFNFDTNLEQSSSNVSVNLDELDQDLRIHEPRLKMIQNDLKI
jgi:hypothetical protein